MHFSIRALLPVFTHFYPHFYSSIPQKGEKDSWNGFETSSPVQCLRYESFGRYFLKCSVRLELHGYCSMKYMLKIWYPEIPFRHSCQVGLHNRGQKIIQSMIHKDVISWSIIISGLAMHGKAEETLTCLSDIRRTSINPNNIDMM
ncbi:hypothetical protein ZOSMA_28G00050 [Zostera marina]|uniref:Pentatricopeptide repeat-containing protein n=1 Tax=Zostera marina TaxID=29655 RepID=A0A0K9PEJ7_ZOSMR|nr:hypothetical protein ZOSMA_28G00050 [Zostera marina]